MERDKTAELQEQMLAALRAQQEAYLQAANAWRESFAKGDSLPSWPEASLGVDALPSPAEVAEVSYAFAAKLLSEQSAFLEALAKAMSGSKEER
jgi:hypothetical protein